MSSEEHGFADDIRAGRARLGIELGSTRIKACLIGSDPTAVLAVGGHEWESTLVDGVWTYAIADVWAGLRATFADLAADAERRHGVRPKHVAALGISAMMHGYLALDGDGEPLVPFRTWRNTSTEKAAEILTDALGINIPQRWSVAHFYQAVLRDEEHVPRVAALTTLAGYVHYRLTGRHVLGIGDASGMFPVDSDTKDYDAAMLDRLDELLAARGVRTGFRALLPTVLVAGADAGSLTPAGAALLDPTGSLAAGAPLCPPEGDAGTGMVATCSVAPRTGNVSAGTSIFAMVVLERPLQRVHTEIDLVATPAGDAVAMVHCNNGANDFADWATLLHRFASAAGAPIDRETVYATMLAQAAEGDADAGGVLAYNYLAGEPIAGITDGRPLLVRTPDGSFSLPNVMRAHLYGVYATLSLGMKVLTDEGVSVDEMFAHGGLFRTPGIAQRILAGALDSPVAVGRNASEGGAWGMALLAAYRDAGAGRPLGEFLHGIVRASLDVTTVRPDPADVAGYAAYLERYRAGLAIQRAAAEAI